MDNRDPVDMEAAAQGLVPDNTASLQAHVSRVAIQAPDAIAVVGTIMNMAALQEAAHVEWVDMEMKAV
jgi:hypothetical protein